MGERYTLFANAAAANASSRSLRRAASTRAPAALLTTSSCAPGPLLIVLPLRGNCAQPDRGQGPAQLVGERQLGRVMGYLDDAARRGCRIITGGRRLTPPDSAGWFVVPTIIERVNLFFGYPAVERVAFRQGIVQAEKAKPKPAPPSLRPIPAELGDSLREVVDPELRACLESLARGLSSGEGSAGPAITVVSTIPVVGRIGGDKKK